MRETRPAHEFLTQGRGHSYSTERKEERLVLPSEIQSLPDREGYLRYEDVAVPVKFAILPKTEIAEPYIPAPIPQRWAAPNASASMPTQNAPKAEEATASSPGGPDPDEPEGTVGTSVVPPATPLNNTYGVQL